MRSMWIACICLASICCRAQEKGWGQRMAATIMATHPDTLTVKPYVTHGKETTDPKPRRPANWNYEQGVALKGFDDLWRYTGDKVYFNYMKKMMDAFVRADGTIRTYDLVEYNIDHVTPGRILLTLYRETHEDKYKKAVDQLREQLQWQPRTKEGGFWHKHRYPYQMWLDGLYMGGPFYAEYTNVFKRDKDFDDVANQFIWMETHSRDAKTGLLYHAWDESRKQRWANPSNGQSPEFWGRAMGWYMMALVDMLDYLPANHARRKDIIAIFQRLSTALEKYQDEAGVWYQIIDKPTVVGNYREASASCMFVYAMAKGTRLGYLDKRFKAVARRGYAGLLKNFIEKDADGLVHLTKTCSGAGLGGTPYRDGSFAYYIGEPLRVDDLKGVGPFIQASIELERMTP